MPTEQGTKASPRLSIGCERTSTFWAHAAI
jgi:hypothetical protein